MGTSIPPVQSWVIESDFMHSIDELGEDFDLQVDVSPFISSVIGKDDDHSKIKTAFMGRRTEASKQKEGEFNKTVSLTVASSSNQLFPDYQYHCGNVFSMLDTFSYVEGKVKKSLKIAKAGYYIAISASDNGPPAPHNISCTSVIVPDNGDKGVASSAWRVRGATFAFSVSSKFAFDSVDVITQNPSRPTFTHKQACTSKDAIYARPMQLSDRIYSSKVTVAITMVDEPKKK